jgi:hypothetical protein
MAAFRFPCRVCGQATDGLDSYVVCSDCIAELDLLSSIQAVDGEPSQSGENDLVHASPSQDEIDARVRKLLDDW